MHLKDFLNEYELDAIESILENKQLNRELFREKRIVCLGSDVKCLVKAIICSFLVLNDSYKENITVYYVKTQESELESIFPKEFLERTDLIEVSVANLSQLQTVDYCVDPGFCNIKMDESDRIERQNFIEGVVQALADKCLKRMILLSDYRSYSNVDSGVVVAEHEYETDQFGNSIRTYEQYIIDQADKLKAAYVVLRSAIALGGKDFDSHPLHEMIKQCGQSEEVTLYLNPDKYTFLYLSDLLGAVLYTTALKNENEVYNVSSANASITTFEIGRILSETIKDRTKLSFIHGRGENSESIAIDSSKLLLAGFSGRIDVQDGFEMALKAEIVKDSTFLFHDTYNGKLSSIQQLMLKVILEIDTICKKHGIKYFLGGGTLLGAIRHQGFIPWDDDADIMMLRKDYDRFVQVASHDLPDYLQLQTAKTDKNNHFFSKIRIKNTICATEFTKKLTDINVGLFVDIFPHDYTANSKFGQRVHQNLTVLTRSLVYNKWNDTYVHGDGSHKLYRFFASVLKTVLPMRFLEWLQFKVIEHYKNKKNRKFLYDGMGQNLKKGPFPKEWLEEAIYVPFESVKLPVPKEYDKYLKHLYGDYMQMIGISKRKNSHNIYLLDLGPYIK